MMRMGKALPLLGILVITIAACAVGQEPILELSISPASVHIPPGGEAHLLLIAKNTSIREADGLSASLTAPDRFAIVTEPETLKVIAPFETGSIDIIVRSEDGIAGGDYKGELSIVYTYCIGELCFQIADSLTFDIAVEAVSKVVQTTSVAAPLHRREVPWPWIGFGAAIVLLGGALLKGGRTGTDWYIYLILVIIAFASLGYGVARNQHEQAQGIGAVLCTSCIGIEDAASREASISTAGLERIAKITEPRELIVFYAPWCHACPFAEAIVAQAAEENPVISYRFVNVEEDPQLAAHYGVTRSGRTIVPAVLRVDTGRIIFGIEKLEERLIELLEEGE